MGNRNSINRHNYLCGPPRKTLQPSAVKKHTRKEEQLIRNES